MASSKSSARSGQRKSTSANGSGSKTKAKSAAAKSTAAKKRRTPRSRHARSRRARSPAAPGRQRLLAAAAPPRVRATARRVRVVARARRSAARRAEARRRARTETASWRRSRARRAMPRTPSARPRARRLRSERPRWAWPADWRSRAATSAPRCSACRCPAPRSSTCSRSPRPRQCEQAARQDLEERVEGHRARRRPGRAHREDPGLAAGTVMAATKTRSGQSTNGNAASSTGAKVKEAGGAVASTARRVRAPALAAGATAVGLAGGMALGSRMASKGRGPGALLAPRPRVLGVPIGRKSGLVRTAEAVGKAAKELSSADQRAVGHQGRGPSGPRTPGAGEQEVADRGRARRADPPARWP